MTEFREFQDGEVVPGTRYRITQLIGSGGMGRVYEVEHLELGKRFVLKALLRELARREDLVARLRNEWRALARLQHPNIVSVTDAGTSANGVPFYVMERLEGETLSARLHRHRRLMPQQALAIASGILEGLHAAHQIGVVHRDVKPPNIFLTGETAVKVLDFGIAKVRDAKDVITARGMAVGTPRYMSPEQANGTPVDARSDIYATGLMLFEMVAGVGPFDDARDANELLLAQLGRKAPLLSSISVVAPELDALVAAMLAKDPRERPPDARQVAGALHALSRRYVPSPATDAPTQAPRPAAPVLLEPPTRVEGQRRATPAAPPTRPDGIAAAGHSTSTVTLRLPTPDRPTSEAPATLYGPDTLVDGDTQAPTVVPAAEPERTELLLAVIPPPGERAGTDPGVTRTAVPSLDAPNLTPPPVVPSGSIPPPRPAPTPKRAPIAAGAAGLLLLGAVVAMALRSGGAPPAAEPGAAAVLVPRTGSPATLVSAPLPASPAPLALPPPAPSAAPEPSPVTAPVKIPELVPKHSASQAGPARPPAAAAARAKARAVPAATRPTARPAMPGSGL